VFFSVGTPLPGVDELTGGGGGAIPGVRLEPEVGVTLLRGRPVEGGTVKRLELSALPEDIAGAPAGVMPVEDVPPAGVV
jgi:hypothetical protein